MPRCPGSDMRNLRVSYHPCPKCGKPVEFFSDELRMRCPHCKTMVVREDSPSCIQYCHAAKDCLGPELFKMLMGDDDQERKEEKA